MLSNMNISHMFHLVPYLMISTFIKCMVLLIIAALMQIYYNKLPSHTKHQFWLVLIVLVIFAPLFSLLIPPGSFPFSVKSTDLPNTVPVLDTVIRSYGELDNHVQTALGMDVSAPIRQSTRQLFTWQVVCGMLWLSGLVYFLTRVIIGQFGINRMRANARIINNRNIMQIRNIVVKEFNIRRNVQVLTSSSCRVPFTYRTFKPVILLPPGANSWPEQRIRSVLMHELAHVMRFDSLTQQFARVVCAIFWFVPLVWIAYRKMHMEQEKSCDECVLDRGVEATHYARHILNIVASARGRLLLTGIYFSRGKRNMLEKRILHLLYFDRLGIISKKWIFIVTILLGVLLIIPVLASNPIAADDKEYIMHDNEELYGRWVNLDYFSEKRGLFVVLAYNRNGTYEASFSDGSRKPPYIGDYIVHDKWTDSEGNIFYKYYATGPGSGGTKMMGEGYWLARISDSGKTFESVFSAIDYADEIDPESLKHVYMIYYRQ